MDWEEIIRSKQEEDLTIWVGERKDAIK